MPLHCRSGTAGHLYSMEQISWMRCFQLWKPRSLRATQLRCNEPFWLPSKPVHEEQDGKRMHFLSFLPEGICCDRGDIECIWQTLTRQL